MDGGSDSQVLIVQASQHPLSYSQHQPPVNLPLSMDPPSERQPNSTTQQDIPRTSPMSQPQWSQSARPSTLSSPSQTLPTTMSSNAVEPAVTSSLDSLSPSSPLSNTAEATDQPNIFRVMEAVTPQETIPAVPALTDPVPTQTADSTESPQQPPAVSMESTTDSPPQPAPPATPGTPPLPALVDPITPPETMPPPPAPQTSEPAEWMNIEEDTSIPDEEELKAYEGKMQSVSALDVKHHEELFYPEIDDPEQRPVKKIRLTWVIKGVRGAKDKPNTARVINSPAALVDGFYWSIRFFPRGNNASALSAYIKCTKKQPKPDSNPPESTFSFVQGGPKTDLSEVKPEAELTTPPPVELDDVAAPMDQDSKPEEDLNRNSAEAQNSRPALASEGADTSEDEEDEDEEDWRVSAQIGMIVYNPQEPRTKYEMSSEHQFNKHNDDWGWTNFHGPWTDIPRRRPTQHQALLRNDTIAMDAYVRIFEDPTQALWWHESHEHEKVWDSKSLAGYFAMGTPPLYHSPGVAGITSWLLLAPFRKILQCIDTSGWRRDSRVKPQPLVCQVQLVLYMMRKMKKDDHYVNVNDILQLMETLGESHGDVFSFWEAFRRSIELELTQESAMHQISDIFDGRTEDGRVSRHTKPLQIDVEKASSVQEGLENALSSLSEKQQFPKFLPVALARDKFDTNLREWKLLYHRVKLDEEVDISRWATDQTSAKYTLYGFVAHVGERSSGKFYSILRPNGPGTKWLAFEDGDGNKVFSYTKHRIQEFEGLEGEELNTNKSTRQTAYLVMYIRTDVLAEFLPGALEPYQMATWLRPHLAAPCYTEDEPDDEGKETSDFETAIEIYLCASGGSILCPHTYTLKDLTLISTPSLKVTVPRETTYSELRHKIAKWKEIDNVERIRFWKMKLGPFGEHMTSSMEKVRLHRSVSGSGDSVRPLCLWMHLLENEEQVKLFGDPDQSLDYDPFAKPIFDDEAALASESSPAEAAVSGDAVQAATGHDQTDATENVAQDTPDSSSAMPEGEAAAIFPAPSSVETPAADTDHTAAPDIEQDSIAAAVSSSVAGPDEQPSLVETRSLPEPSEGEQAAADAEQDAVAEAVSMTVNDPAGNAPPVETGSSGQIENTRVDPEFHGSTRIAENATAEVGATERTVPNMVNHQEDNATSTTPSAAGSLEPIVGGTTEENGSQTTTPRAVETSTEVVPSSDSNPAPVENPAVDAQPIVAEEDGLTLDVPTGATAEDQAANEAMIAALIVADLQAVDSEQPPQEPVNVDVVLAPLPDVSGLPPDAWDVHLAPPPPQAAIAGDIVDSRSEGSSANDEPPRPVPHVYGFIQLFDAMKQEFSLHGDFIAQDSAEIKATVREVLGYPEDKDFLVWTRLQSYKTAAIAVNSIFEALDGRSDGFVLIVGDVHSESTKTALVSEGKFTNPEQLSRYLWMSARKHPTQALTGEVTMNVFGTHFYSGPMVKGLYDGRSARHIAANGQTYDGPYVAGERSGDEGKMTYQNGDVYEGSWLKNEKHGQGTFVEKRTGNKYVGGFQNGKRWGKGTTHWEVADEEGDMCQICYSEEIDALFYDCGHVCACVECAKQVDACPICRKNVRHVVRMYRS